ncbi:hypothetical protein ABW19_dt0202965 [Dactylella cylindrospora]|nr:hypothetical protein ABW19_dt0202965 [Dactylella cylindrospora]
MAGLEPDVDSDDDQGGFDSEVGDELGMALASVGGMVSDDEEGDVVDLVGGRRQRGNVVSGKRPAEGGAYREGTRKRVRLDGELDWDSGDDDDEEGEDGMDLDPESDDESAASSLGADPGQRRRKLWFEEDISSSEGSDYEEEPTSYLTALRQKEAANARRRKANIITPEPPGPDYLEKKKRPPRGQSRAHINDQYRDLLNEAINDARDRRVYPDVNFKSSEIGEVFWSFTEKQRFFRALPRVGRHNPAALSEEIESKTVIEVQGYLDVLKEETDRRMQKVGSKRHELLMMADIPAAIEVGEECDDLLDKEAERVKLHVERIEEKEERERWGDEGGTLDVETAKEMKGIKREDGENPHENGLLDTWNWLMLADRIFMASEHRKNKDPTAISKQALQDLATLVTSITRRLVNISLFQAHSRIKNRSGPLYRVSQPDVTLRDVAAALKLLGMPTTSEEYWRHVPRRFQLRVLSEQVAKRGEKPFLMEYDEVENELKVFEYIKFHKGSEITSDDEQPTMHHTASSRAGLLDGWETDDEEEELEDSDEDENETTVREYYPDTSYQDGHSGVPHEGEFPSASEITTDKRPRNKSEMARYLDTPIDLASYLPAAPLRNLSSKQKRQILDELHFINEDEEYLDAIDTYYSLREEKKLWKILGGWKDRKELLEGQIRDAEAAIPPEPALLGWRRLENWKRSEWREQAGPMVPIWEQRWYGKLWENEKVVRIKKVGGKREKGRRGAAWRNSKGRIDTDGDVEMGEELMSERDATASEEDDGFADDDTTEDDTE